MKITEQICKDTVDDAKLDQLESKLKYKLPRSYREFLKKHNGGRPDPSQFHFITKEGVKQNSLVHYFFALYEGRIGSLLKQYELTLNRIPTGYLPIGTDPFGNLILIPMLDQPDVSVHFWDHEKEAGEATFDNVFLVADSFDGFISGLH